MSIDNYPITKPPNYPLPGPELAIAGAGEIGGLVAHLVARRNLVSSIRLVDESASAAAGKALDIAQAGAIESFATRVSASADLYSISAADIVVVADRFIGGEWSGEDALMLLKRLSQAAPQPVIVCAGAGHREVIDRASRELRIPRRILIGSAAEALAGALRAIVGLEIDGSPQDAALAVLGVPPSNVVVTWEEAAIGGMAAARLLDTHARRRIAARVPSLWPTGPYALAAAAAAAIARIVGRSRGLISCFVAPDDSAGRRARAAAMPVRLGSRGIVQVVIPELSVHDRVALENATSL